MNLPKDRGGKLLYSKKYKFIFVDTYDSLAKNCKIIQKSLEGKDGLVALDTEFIRRSSYFPILSTIQMCTEDRALLIDCQSILKNSAIENINTHVDIKNFLSTLLEPLRHILFSSKILKIFYAAFQDCEIFFNLFEKIPYPILDTQIAVTFLEDISENGNIRSYEKTVKKLLGINIDKSCQQSNWLARPLTPEQIEYAIHDVTYLYEISKKLIPKLKQSSIFPIALEESKERFSENNYKVNFFHQTAKFPFGINEWKEAFLLKRLLELREMVAQDLNKVRSHIISDNALFDICRGKYISANLIKKVGQRSSKYFCTLLWEKHDLFKQFIGIFKNARRDILNSNEECIEEKETVKRIIKEKVFDHRDKNFILIKNKIEKICYTIAKKNKLPVNIFAPKAIIEKMAKNIFFKKEIWSEDFKLSQGWRRQFLEDHLQNIK